MAALSSVLAAVTVAAVASTSVHSDCPSEVTTSLLQANYVEKQRGVTKEGQTKLEATFDINRTADEGFSDNRATGSVALLEENRDPEQKGKKRDKVVFIKLHKVGGTTLAQILRRRCDNSGFRCNGVLKNSPPWWSTFTHDGLSKLASEYAGKFDIWAQHVVLEPVLLDTLVPGNVKVALFRNPVDRVSSSFRFAASLSGPKAATDIIHALQQGELPTKLCDDFDRSFHEASQHRYCCGPGAGTAMSGQIPLEHFDQLDLVMLTEEYDMSLIMFRNFVKWDLQEMLYLKLRHHTGEMTPELAAANTEVEEYFRGGNATITTEVGRRFYSTCISGDEAKLYDMAKQKYKQQWDSFSPSEQEELHAELAVFQEALATLDSCCLEHPLDLYCMELSELTEDWLARHGGSIESPESLPYPMQVNFQMPDQKNLAGLAPPFCKGKALNVLHQSSAWQKV